MISYSFYHKETGLLHERKFGTDDLTQVPRNTPADHIAIEGDHDHLSKRIDIDAHQRHEALRAAFRVERITAAFQDSPLEHRQSRQMEVDAAAAAVLIDYQPPAPSPDHEWNAETKRWQLSAAAQAKRQARASALTQIAALEASQHRHVREALLDQPGAKEALQGINTQITALRAAL